MKFVVKFCLSYLSQVSFECILSDTVGLYGE